MNKPTIEIARGFLKQLNPQTPAYLTDLLSNQAVEEIVKKLDFQTVERRINKLKESLNLLKTAIAEEKAYLASMFEPSP